jgi:hypothetical protein
MLTPPPADPHTGKHPGGNSATPSRASAGQLFRACFGAAALGFEVCHDNTGNARNIESADLRA